jgi:hypothetical protein
MRYTITVEHDRKHYRYTVEQIPVDQRTGHFKFIARNKTITITSNRPYFRNKGLKHCRYEIKVLEDYVCLEHYFYEGGVLQIES